MNNILLFFWKVSSFFVFTNWQQHFPALFYCSIIHCNWQCTANLEFWVLFVFKSGRVLSTVTVLQCCCVRKLNIGYYCTFRWMPFALQAFWGSASTSCSAGCSATLLSAAPPVQPATSRSWKIQPTPSQKKSSWKFRKIFPKIWAFKTQKPGASNVWKKINMWKSKVAGVGGWEKGSSEAINSKQLEMAHHQVPAPALRAYSDPSIFRNDRVSNATMYLI